MFVGILQPECAGFRESERLIKRGAQSVNPCDSDPYRAGFFRQLITHL
jgi:hypothetical protein